MFPDFDSALAAYDYAFPPELIANAPADPRDSSRLAVLDRSTGETQWTTFRVIGEYLPPNALLVLNETKVIPARLPVTRATGGKTELLVLGVAGGQLRALANKKLRAGETLTIDGDDRTLTVSGSDEKEWILTPSFSIAELSSVLDTAGRMPLPPYIKNSPLSQEQIKERYQTVFARNAGSIAAPTASLHFTPELLASLERQGIAVARVTLHVHLGTFAPLTAEQWASGQLHREEYVIELEQARMIEQAKADGRPIIAVGTTAVRTLESAADENGHLTHLSGQTRLFIREGYVFRMVDGMITNFHVPKSSLLMLVCAFAGRERVMALYRQAIQRKFRLFSFGDAMLIR
jgi:S-adenosylmethionine:tRNA ribosyltransferase-isomerase